MKGKKDGGLPLVDTCMLCHLVEKVEPGWTWNKGTDRQTEGWMEGWIGRWVDGWLRALV